MNSRVSICNFYVILSIIICLGLIDMKNPISSEIQLILNYMLEGSETLPTWNQNS